MDLRKIGEWLAGSAAIYVIVVACGSSDGGSSTHHDASVGGKGGAGGAGGGGGSILDALGDPVPDALADVNQSGSRLKAKYLASADGAKQFLQKWHDTQLGLDCTFMYASDAKIRCLPDAKDQFYYIDDKCTQPIINDPNEGSCPSKYVRDFAGSSGACSTEQAWRLYEKGASVTTGTVYMHKTPSTCDYLSPVSNQLPLFVAVEVSPTTFVEATEQTEP